MNPQKSRGKSFAAERFTKTLKNKIYKYIILVSKYRYINKLNDIVKTHNHSYHNTIKMKPVDVNPTKLNSTILMKKIMQKILKLKLVPM